MDGMVIINGGLPRSGTVLVGAIICAVLRRQGRRWLRFNPQERRDLESFADRVRTWSGPDVLLVHTHLIDNCVLAALASRPNSLLVWNHRDPRDALVSLCQLHDMALTDGLKAMHVYLGAGRLAATARHVIRLRYETMMADPSGTIRRLAGCLGEELDEASISQIASETSSDSHAQVMHALAHGTRPGHRVTTMRRTMIEDPETLINDRHIQSGASGRWLRELSEADQALVAQALGPAVAELGYSES